MTAAGREGLWLTLASAAAVTLLDAVFLELQRGFFTGGFLARDSATAPLDRVVFALGSLALDAVCAGLGVLVALAIASGLRWGRVARRCLALLLGAGPLALASLVEYQMLARLGDAFDLHLMFDLVGRRPAEILAVSSTQLLVPLAAMVAAVVLVVYGLHRLNRRAPQDVRLSPGWRGLLAWMALALALTAATTVSRATSEVQDNGLRRKASGQAVGAFVTLVSDVDRDGHGLLSRPADPAPWDARVYPYARDIPGNGIDEDGIGGDLPAGAGDTAVATTPTFAQTPPVVVVMLETFRADLIGAREGSREITPELNRLAREGASATRAYSHNGYTVQSRFHLFTGGLTRQPGSGTLLDDFRRNGYQTAYFSAQDESFGGRAFAIGANEADVFYDARQDRARRYTTFTTAGSLGVSSEVVLERVSSFLATRSDQQPLFLYVNFYDTHFPYWHEQLEALVDSTRVPQAAIVEGRAADVQRMYRNAAANVDRAVGRLRQLVRERVGPDAAFIVLADHGESLFDDGFLGHGYVLNDVQTRIPVIAAGLALDLCEPFGQADIRAAIVTALASPAVGRRPSLRACPGRSVFQYLGTVDRPRQIAFVSAQRRLIYDFRDDRVQVNQGRWQPTRDLDAPLRREWLDLVHHWERLRLPGATAQESS